MPPRLKLAAAFLLGCGMTFMVAFLAAHWYLGGSTRIAVENRSGVRLESVMVSGSGYEAFAGDVEPGSVAHVRVYPRGESSLRITFQANGSTVSEPLDTYLEGGGGYSARIVVNLKLDATAEVESYSTLGVLIP